MEEEADAIWRQGLFYDEVGHQEDELVPSQTSGEAREDSFTFGGVSIQLQRPHDTQTNSLSAHIWRSSLLLTSFLAGQAVHSLVGKEVLEVGCGRAMVGLFAVAVGAAVVTLTDCDDRALFVLSRIESERLKIRHFLWESDMEDASQQHWSNAYRCVHVPQLESGKKFDVIGGSDCLYFHCQELPLVAVLHMRLRKDGVAFFSVQRRGGTFCCEVRMISLSVRF
jgi:predicted nicotinamide N-methyase